MQAQRHYLHKTSHRLNRGRTLIFCCKRFGYQDLIRGAYRDGFSGFIRWTLCPGRIERMRRGNSGKLNITGLAVVDLALEAPSRIQ